jgi:hypothetical protein
MRDENRQAYIDQLEAMLLEYIEKYGPTKAAMDFYRAGKSGCLETEFGPH